MGTPEELAHGWQAAEERLYPVVMVRPDVYQRSLTLVRAVADRLRWAGTPDELAEAFAGSAEVVAQAVRETGTSTEGLDLGLVAGAAFNVRHREILAETGREQAEARIREARERGERWVVVYEAGREDLPPYRRLEMRVPDGLGLHAFVEPDPDTGWPRWGIELLQLHPTTGGRARPDPLERRSYADREAWVAAIREVQQEMPSSGGEARE